MKNKVLYTFLPLLHSNIEFLSVSVLGALHSISKCFVGRPSRNIIYDVFHSFHLLIFCTRWKIKTKGSGKMPKTPELGAQSPEPSRFPPLDDLDDIPIT